MRIDRIKLYSMGLLVATAISLLGALVVMHSLYENANNHEYFSDQLSMRNAVVMNGYVVPNRSDIFGVYEHVGTISYEGDNHYVQVRLAIQPDGKFTSTGLVGPYYFENIGLWNESSDGVVLNPLVGTGARLPFYGEMNVSDVGLESTTLNYVKNANATRIEPSQYSYSKSKDPRLYVSLGLLALSVVLHRRRKVYQQKHQDNARGQENTPHEDREVS